MGEAGLTAAHQSSPAWRVRQAVSLKVHPKTINDAEPPLNQTVEPFLKTDHLNDTERAMLTGGACAKAYGWSRKKGERLHRRCVAPTP
jgi:hypothetical protein